MYNIRSYVPEVDKNFILSSFLKSYKNAPEIKYISDAVYYSSFKQQFIDLLEYEAILGNVLIITNAADPTQIYGYIIFNQTEQNDPNNILPLITIHYIYIKYPFRKFRIATEVLQNLGVDKNTPTLYTYARNFNNIPEAWTYDPYRRGIYR